MNNNTSALRRTPLTFFSVAAVAALGLSACAPDDTEDAGQAEEVQEETTDEQVSDEQSPEDATDEGTAGDEATEETTEDAGDGATDEETAADDEATETETDAGSGGDHPVYRAIEAALAEYDGGVITEFEDNTDEDGYVEVFVYDGETEWELEVDSESFEIIDTEDDGIDADDREEAEAAEIEISEAIETAESEGGAEPSDGELDTEDGTVVWQIELTNDTEVYVDVGSGEVVKVDQ